ncbi:DUF3797 domain-containing protein [Brevibacillus laterosporus]|uniref:DUF3797 domain-containing protein n=1 Tax=Brevibacillus laterosporus TaxID=1465 RepID=UPI000E6B6704|nr:DUF3797 domain-containing protein [Brevibacillus laterosporus]AYB41029.1 DUF3797 domain-containing protein [Brevibacillus laterosporus]AYB41438.1 DUF3797 domain-containing protein [Brevibacillus laterosporus]MBG9799510.1 hypothetical protein [Brevibacillus laterosporus]MBM7106941.1 hypothetical protein [Brevibacillus laterosporus]MED1909772.1 DUF3797 domain-containing protein [Brevibacillus laterosporus]
MNALKSVQLMSKYSNCKECGSDKIDNGEGTLIVDNNIFKRSCKCGWSIEVDENDNKLLNLKISAWATVGPRKIYELHDKNDRFFGYVSVNELQKMGYVKRIDHSKKAEEFFNTPEGLDWVKKNRFFKVL